MTMCACLSLLMADNTGEAQLDQSSAARHTLATNSERQQPDLLHLYR